MPAPLYRPTNYNNNNNSNTIFSSTNSFSNNSDYKPKSNRMRLKLIFITLFAGIWIFGFSLFWYTTRKTTSLGTTTTTTTTTTATNNNNNMNNQKLFGKPEDASIDFLKNPHTTETTWHGQIFKTDSDWDFYGLKIPPTSAMSRIKDGQISSSYDLKVINESDTPRGYEAPSYGEAALKYPDPNSRLFVTASTRPRVLFFPNIVTEDEVDYLVSVAEPKLSRSLVANRKNNNNKTQSSSKSQVRTSQSAWIDLTGKLENLNKRLCTIVGSTWHEPMNVLRYGNMQHYDSHHDYFDPNLYGSQENNRMATFYLYLSDTPSGGATTIPRANGGRPPINMQEAACQQGLQVYPRKGAGVLFYNMRPDHTLDPLSLHGACDVMEGVKWGGPVWFRAPTPKGTGNSRD